jgi:hypothetical protein
MKMPIIDLEEYGNYVAVSIKESMASAIDTTGTSSALSLLGSAASKLYDKRDLNRDGKVTEAEIAQYEMLHPAVKEKTAASKNSSQPAAGTNKSSVLSKTNTSRSLPAANANAAAVKSAWPKDTLTISTKAKELAAQSTAAMAKESLTHQKETTGVQKNGGTKVAGYTKNGGIVKF